MNITAKEVCEHTCPPLDQYKHPNQVMDALQIELLTLPWRHISGVFGRYSFMHWGTLNVPSSVFTRDEGSKYDRPEGPGVLLGKFNHCGQSPLSSGTLSLRMDPCP